MNEQRNNGKGIFYGVIGVATLIVAIIGATFAYFTATQSAGENEITGNAATVNFGLAVQKETTVDEEKNGMIPMTDGMLKAALENGCLDDNDNAVCQVYSVTVTNNGSASLFLDGYVNLTGGAPGGATQDPTNMRWAQVFATTTGEGDTATTTYSMTGSPALAPGATGITAYTDIATSGTDDVDLDSTGTASGTYTYAGNTYDYINKNYMRTSGHTGETFSRTADLSSALVYNQFVAPSTDTTNSVAKLYFVVWLSETGEVQNMDADKSTSFFGGIVNFVSAAGGEVSATFNGYTRRPATTTGA